MCDVSFHWGSRCCRSSNSTCIITCANNSIIQMHVLWHRWVLCVATFPLWMRKFDEKFCHNNLCWVKLGLNDVKVWTKSWKVGNVLEFKYTALKWLHTQASLTFAYAREWLQGPLEFCHCSAEFSMSASRSILALRSFPTAKIVFSSETKFPPEPVLKGLGVLLAWFAQTKDFLLVMSVFNSAGIFSEVEYLLRLQSRRPLTHMLLSFMCFTGGSLFGQKLPWRHVSAEILQALQRQSCRTAFLFGSYFISSLISKSFRALRLWSLNSLLLVVWYRVYLHLPDRFPPVSGNLRLSGLSYRFMFEPSLWI